MWLFTMELIGRTIHNKYRLTEKITESPLARIYRARDLEGGRDAEITILKRTAISGRIEDAIRFRTEASSAALFDHPNIIRIYDIGEVFELIFIASEFLPGEDLSDRLRRGAIAPEQCLAYMIQLCSALEYAHGKGILHRNLKPEYIRIVNGTLKLSGFGLARIIEFNELMRHCGVEEIFGCIAPEQSGMIKRGVDERSDLYALGILFYRMAAGQLPFTGDTVSSIVYRHVAAVPVPPSQHDGRISASIDRVILKLLEKDPARRYQSARGLIFDMKKIISGEPDFIPGLDDRTTRIDFRTRLIDRDDEFSLIVELYRATWKGVASLCLVSGEAGAGKTRLIEEFRNYVYSAGGVVAGGRCIANETKQPYGPFRDVLDNYLKIFSGYPEGRRSEIRRLLSAGFHDLGSVIITINPSMKEILGECPQLPSRGTERQESRFHGAAARFFHLLSSVENGLVIILDDLQWTDGGSLDILREIIHGGDEYPLMIIGSCRTGGVAENQHLSRFLAEAAERGREPVTISLGQFDRGTMRDFISALLLDEVDQGGDIAEYIGKKSSGNPLYATELVRQLVAEGALSHRGGAWVTDWKVLGSLETPGAEVDIIIKRIHALDAADKGVLSRAAVIGRKFDLELLFRLCAESSEEVVKIIDRAIALHLIEVDPLEKERLLFAHDRVREAFYSDIEEPERQRLHGALAGYIEKTEGIGKGPMLFDLAHHAIEADDRDRAIRYAYPAGVMARASYAFEDAIRYFRKAIQYMESAGMENAGPLLECRAELGSAYVTTGRYDDAIELFNGILPGAADPMLKAHWYSQICNAYYRKGDWNNCEEYAARGLALLGESLSRTRAQAVRGIIAGLAVRLLHVALPFIFVRKSPGPRGDTCRKIIEFFEPLSMAYSLNDPIKLVRAVIRILNLAERHIGPSIELAMTCYGFAGVCMAVPLFGISKKYHDRSLAMNEALGYEWGSAKNRELLGYYHEWTGDFKRGIECFNDGLEIYQRLGDVKERMMILNGLEHCHYYTGDYETARQVNDRYCEIGTEAGDDYAVTAAEIYYSQLCRETGDLDGAEAHAGRSNDLSREKKIWFNYCSSLIEMGCNALERGEPGKAAEFLESARRLHEENNFLRQYVVLVYACLARAYCDDFARNEHSLPPGERRRHLARIRRACRKALSKTRKWPTHHGAALRVAGTGYALAGDHGRARRYFQESLEHCGRTGRRFELALGYYEFGHYLFQAGDAENSRIHLEGAYRIFSDIGARLHAARLRALLGIGEDESEGTSIQRLIEKERESAIQGVIRDVGRISDIDELLNMIISRAIELTGALACYLFILDTAGGKPELRAAKSVQDAGRMEYSREIVDAVFSSGGTVLSDTGEAPVSGSGGSVKSVMCVPIRAGERILGACYLENSLSGTVFSETDARFLSTYLTPAALKIEEMLSRKIDSRETREPEREPSLTKNTEEKLKAVMAYIEKNYYYDISREGLASMVDMSPNHLGKFFKVYTGRKVGDYINKLRVDDAVARLEGTDDSVIDIAFSVGFESLRTFNRAFLDMMNSTPSEYRKKIRSNPS